MTGWARRRTVSVVALGIGLSAVGSAVSACSGEDDVPAPTSTTPASSSTSSTTRPPPERPAFEQNADGAITLRWDQLRAEPFFGFDEVTDPGDPFWLINTNDEEEGFGLTLELFTTGYGPTWTGETGEVALGCNDAESGICIHLDPDGPGPAADLNADFDATGTIIIDRLDEDGYDLTLRDVAFSSGATMSGDSRLFGGVVEPGTTSTTQP